MKNFPTVRARVRARVITRVYFTVLCHGLDTVGTVTNPRVRVRACAYAGVRMRACVYAGVLVSECARKCARARARVRVSE